MPCDPGKLYYDCRLNLLTQENSAILNILDQVETRHLKAIVNLKKHEERARTMFQANNRLNTKITG
jgi:hypothetical protein